MSKTWIDGAWKSDSGAWFTISETVFSSNTASITFSSLDSYEEIEVRWPARSTQVSGAADAILCRFNGDTGSNYNYAYSGRFNGASSSESSGQTAGWVAWLASQQTNADRFSMGIINLACDQTAAHRKYVFAQCAAGRSTSETPAANIFTTEWTNTANAITSMTLLPLSGLFEAGSRFTVLGRL